MTQFLTYCDKTNNRITEGTKEELGTGTGRKSTGREIHRNERKMGKR
jgi:hypothetical protein